MAETEIVGCDVCKGRKSLIGLGCIPVDCWKCKGIGWAEILSQSFEDRFLQSIAAKEDDESEDFGIGLAPSLLATLKPSAPRAKRGRPKKAT